MQSGLKTNNFSGAGGPATWLMQGNTITAYGAGIWHNLEYNQGTSLTIEDNTISSLVAPNSTANALVRANYDGQSVGILLVSIQDQVGVTITGNTITGMGYGVTLYNTTTGNTITIGASNDISGNGVGVELTNLVAFNPVTTTVLGGSANNPTGTGQAIVDDLALSDNTTGILVQDANTATAFGVTLSVQDGTSITGGTTGLAVDGAARQFGRKHGGQHGVYGAERGLHRVFQWGGERPGDQCDWGELCGDAGERFVERAGVCG